MPVVSRHEVLPFAMYIDAKAWLINNLCNYVVIKAKTYARRVKARA